MTPDQMIDAIDTSTAVFDDTNTLGLVTAYSWDDEHETCVGWFVPPLMSGHPARWVDCLDLDAGADVIE